MISNCISVTLALVLWLALVVFAFVTLPIFTLNTIFTGGKWDTEFRGFAGLVALPFTWKSKVSK